MARVFPSDLSKLALAGAHRAELAMLALLRKRLPDDYTVFHGVHWSREYAKWTHFGEVDFVVVNRSGDVLLVEQKNGALADGDDGLVKQYEDGDKNVNDQIRRSVDKVREKFKWQHGSGRKLGLDYLIHCPDHRVVKVNAAALDMTRIVDAGARDGLAGRIQSVLGPGSAVAGDWGETVRAFFRQTLDLVPDIHAHIDAQESAFVRRAGGLAELLSRLEMDPFRLRIRGTAGCGKSLVAREAHDRAVENGRRPLLLCFNRSLVERLRGLASNTTILCLSPRSMGYFPILRTDTPTPASSSGAPPTAWRWTRPRAPRGPSTTGSASPRSRGASATRSPPSSTSASPPVRSSCVPARPDVRPRGSASAPATRSIDRSPSGRHIP